VALGDTEALEALLAAGGDVERETGRGSLLEVAAGAGDADMVRFLVAQGAEVDRAGRGGATALVRAASAGSAEAVAALLRAGAAPRAAPPGGQSAVEVAEARGDAGIHALLLQHELVSGADRALAASERALGAAAREAAEKHDRELESFRGRMAAAKASTGERVAALQAENAELRAKYLASG